MAKKDRKNINFRRFNKRITNVFKKYTTNEINLLIVVRSLKPNTAKNCLGIWIQNGFIYFVNDNFFEIDKLA